MPKQGGVSLRKFICRKYKSAVENFSTAAINFHRYIHNRDVKRVIIHCVSNYFANIKCSVLINEVKY